MKQKILLALLFIVSVSLPAYAIVYKGNFNNAIYGVDQSTGAVSIGTNIPQSSVGLTVNGTIAATGNSTNHAVCWKANGILGFCSVVVDASGICGTCN